MKGSDRKGQCLNEEGVALLLVLWVLILLMVIVMSFSYMTRTELEAGVYFRERLRDDMLAEGAIQRAVLEVFYAKRNPAAEGLWRTDGRTNAYDQDFEVRVLPESSRMDLNSVPDVILRGLLSTLGVGSKEQDIIVDSILDWRDADDLHRLHGAEDEYYNSLDRPYKAKNGNLDSIEELLLIRGVTAGLFYGEGEKRGLKDLVTVYSGSAKINVNTAGREALQAIPGMSSQIVEAIIDHRSLTPFRDISELQAVVGDIYSTVSQYLDVMEGDVYRVTAYKRGSEYGTEAVIRFVGEDYTVVRWNRPAGILKENNEQT